MDFEHSPDGSGELRGGIGSRRGDASLRFGPVGWQYEQSQSDEPRGPIVLHLGDQRCKSVQGSRADNQPMRPLAVTYVFNPIRLAPLEGTVRFGPVPGVETP